MRLNNVLVLWSLLLGKLSSDARISEDIKKESTKFCYIYFHPEKTMEVTSNIWGILRNYKILVKISQSQLRLGKKG